MRKLALPILILGLATVSVAWAAGGPDGDSTPPPATDKAATAPAATLPDAPAPAKTAAATPATTAAPTAATPAIESELAELRSLLHAQAAEIEAQRRELADMKAKLGTVKDEAVTAAVSAAVPAATTAATEAATAAAPAAAGILPGNALTGGGQGDSPLAIHFKGITLTPGGFLAGETVYRNRALSADINTPFTAVPFSGNDLSKISEFNATGRQSRITLLADGQVASAHIYGYYEGDFLGAGPTSNNNETNSYLFRQRQAWAGLVLDSGWGVSGGQMWSLVTETKEGLNNRTSKGGENANVPLTIDPQYTVGFSWARQYGFRVVKSFYDKKFWLGASVEGSQSKYSADVANLNFVLFAPGNTSGLYNPISAESAAAAATVQSYTLNAAPDFVLKAAVDPGWGHYELFGAIRIFRDRVYPCALASVAVPCSNGTTTPSSFGANEDSRAGGFAGANLRVPFFNKKLEVGFHALYGDGVGRYGTTGLADTTVRPDGTLAPIRGGQGLAAIEWHATPRIDVYAYGGGEYVARAIFNTVAQTATVAGVNIGYGSPFVNNSGCEAPLESLPTVTGFSQGAGSCKGDPRNVIEGTIGFWHRIYQGEHGRIQWGLQYSYYVLNAWSGTTGSAITGSAQFRPSANDNMFFTSFRYYLP